MTEPPGLTVVVCTRDRPEQLKATLDSLASQSGPPFPVVVVDQSEREDPSLAARAHADDRLEVVRDSRRGLSRARNIGTRHCSAEWVAFVDDDCVPEHDWAERLREELALPSGAEMVAGHVDAAAPRADYVPVAAFPVQRRALLRGRFCHPGKLGFGVCMAVRRSTIERLGGWDERLGAGVEHFPASEDMDFNYRLLRSGGTGLITPSPRSRHEQWRRPEQLESLYRGYMRGWAGFAAKHLRSGDPLGGAWLLVIGAIDALDMLDSGLRGRSRLRLRLARAKARGLLEGTVAGLRIRW